MSSKNKKLVCHRVQKLDQKKRKNNKSGQPKKQLQQKKAQKKRFKKKRSHISQHKELHKLMMVKKTKQKKAR